MKTSKFLLILILCLVHRFVFSQTYYPIPVSNAVWDIVLYPDPEDPYQPPYRNHFLYRPAGDTLVNGIAYQKLNRIMINTKCSVDTSVELRGFIRNDIESRKVYYRDISQGAESLLYDFNLLVGDTLKGSVFMSISYQVGEIDSILIINNYHKRYSIYFGGYFSGKYLIEGVGTTVGLIERVTGFWPFYDLRCFSQDGQLGYLSPWATDCQLETDTCYVGIDENINAPKVQLFPNPARDYLYVSMNNTLHPSAEFLFTLYDISGRIIYKGQFVNSLFINCATYTRGLFFYRISSKSQRTDIFGKVLFE